MDVVSDDCICTGISGVSDEDKRLTISPNPFIDQIKIETDLPIHTISVVYPILKKLNINDQHVVEDISKYYNHQGIYILKIEVSGFSPIYKKILKM
ncbi:MAG: hypothetical protein IPN89_17760 [Saprospiraceae bacterium]|nr:hypothetical protein [Saprospiraceae bacterium]